METNAQIREHMEVIGADGQRIGRVDKVEGDRIKLTKNDAPDGQHHYIELSQVRATDEHLHVAVTAADLYGGQGTGSASGGM